VRGRKRDRIISYLISATPWAISSFFPRPSPQAQLQHLTQPNNRQSTHRMRTILISTTWTAHSLSPKAQSERKGRTPATRSHRQDPLGARTPAWLKDRRGYLVDSTCARHAQQLRLRKIAWRFIEGKMNERKASQMGKVITVAALATKTTMVRSVRCE